MNRLLTNVSSPYLSHTNSHNILKLVISLKLPLVSAEGVRTVTPGLTPTGNALGAGSRHGPISFYPTPENINELRPAERIDFRLFTDCTAFEDAPALAAATQTHGRLRTAISTSQVLVDFSATANFAVTSTRVTSFVPMEWGSFGPAS